MEIYFSQVWEAEKSSINVLAGLVSGEGTFFIDDGRCKHMVEGKKG
jgi:hypothetical protein